MRRLPASSVFRGPKLGKQGLPTEFRYQGIISYRVVEAFEPLIIGSYQLRFVLLGEDFLHALGTDRLWYR